MSKKAYFVAFGCFIIGLLLGIAGATAYLGKSVADGLFLMKDLEVAQSGIRAFEAYQQESRPVAIYALKQHLETLTDAEDLGGENPVFMTELQIAREIAFTHARLAKLHEQSGDTDLASMHVSEALRKIARTERFKSITDWDSLRDLVAKFDEKEIP
jgi:hypothetical protein